VWLISTLCVCCFLKYTCKLIEHYSLFADFDYRFSDFVGTHSVSYLISTYLT